MQLQHTRENDYPIFFTLYKVVTQALRQLPTKTSEQQRLSKGQHTANKSRPIVHQRFYCFVEQCAGVVAKQSTRRSLFWGPQIEKKPMSDGVLGDREYLKLNIVVYLPTRGRIASTRGLKKSQKEFVFIPALVAIRWLAIQRYSLDSDY